MAVIISQENNIFKITISIKQCGALPINFYSQLYAAVHYPRIFSTDGSKKPSALICYCNSAVHCLLAVIATLFKTTSLMLPFLKCCALPTCFYSQDI
jgi:hypothetical protein